MTDRPVFTFSALNTLRQCVFKYWLQYLAGEHHCGVRPKKAAVPLLRGKFGHEVLARYAKTGEMLFESLEDWVAKACEEQELTQKQIDKLMHEMWMLQAASLAYKKMYPDEPKKHWVLIEEEIQMASISKDYVIAGKPDGVFREKEGLILRERKTTKGKPAYPSLVINLQRSIYALCILDQFGELPFASEREYIIMGQWRVKQTESESDFRRRIQGEYEKHPEKMLFRPGRLAFDQESLRRMFWNTVFPLVQKALAVGSTQDPPLEMNDTTCLGMYQATQCPFLPACEAFLKTGRSWDAPECRWLYVSKRQKNPELEEEKKNGALGANLQ